MFQNTVMETTNISTATTMSLSQSDDCVNITDSSVVIKEQF